MTELPTVDRRWRNRNLVRERDLHRARRLGSLALALLLATAPAMVYLVHQNECLKLAYEVNALRAEHERLLERERRLQMERAALEAPEAIERWAVERGMVHSDPSRIVVVATMPRPRGELTARGPGEPLDERGSPR